MKFLCLAYGSEEGWKELSKEEQQALLAQDEVLCRRGDFVTAVEPVVTTVTNWEGKLNTKNESFAPSGVPLAGFSIIEAANLGEAIELIANTPLCTSEGCC